jgi:hypothetical protein
LLEILVYARWPFLEESVRQDMPEGMCTINVAIPQGEEAPAPTSQCAKYAVWQMRGTAWAFIVLLGS